MRLDQHQARRRFVHPVKIIGLSPEQHAGALLGALTRRRFQQQFAAIVPVLDQRPLQRIDGRGRHQAVQEQLPVRGQQRELLRENFAACDARQKGFPEHVAPELPERRFARRNDARRRQAG